MEIHFPNGIIVHNYLKCWIDETEIVDWFKKLRDKREGEEFKNLSLLVWYVFKMHITGKVKQHGNHLLLQSYFSIFLA